MSWSAAPTAPESRYGSAWATTDTAPVAQTGASWFTLDHPETVAMFATVGALSVTGGTSYPFVTAAFSATGALATVSAPVRNVTAGFTATGSLTGTVFTTRSATVNFTAAGSLNSLVNDGLSAIVTGGTPLVDGLSCTISGGLFDGLSATVILLVATPMSAAFNTAGTLTANAVGATGTVAAFASVGALSATIKPVYSITATLVGSGALSTTGTAQFASSAALSSSGTLSATGYASFSSAVDLTGGGLLTGIGYARFAGSASLSGAGALSATGYASFASAPSLTSTGTLSASVTSGNVAISVVGTPQVSQTTTVTLPTHAVDDIIVIFAVRNIGVLPTKPTASGTVPAWVTIDSNATNPAIVTAYFKATATNHTSGTWSGANCMAAIVLRNQNSTTPIGAHTITTGSAANTATAPAVTMTQTDGTSFLLHFYALNPPTPFTSWAAAPAGYTRRAATGFSSTTCPCLNSKDVTTSDGAIAQTGTWASVSYRGTTIEILD